MGQVVLQANGLIIRRGGQAILDEVSVTISRDSSTLVQGPSGAGKTTLFDVLGLLDTPAAGTLLVDDQDVSEIPERRRARIRRDTVGFVFQDFRLIDDLTARENAAVPQEHRGARDEEWLDTLFDALDITDLADQYPATLSGGEKQRVAIARALANRPDVILADEPTGQLDPRTATQVLDLLFDLRDRMETALVVISHDRRLAERFDRILLLEDGTLTERPPMTVDPSA
ncbi:ABC transporter ATP-binding protein [Halalkalicoccus salilacus]|uniref:ABC transporter ATP-binding protein n=1 Tax=Halalkalicoccus salilacus TaxID=3117459 RepID=UPI00300EE532